MLSDKEIVNMTAHVHETLKKHNLYKRNIQSAKAWTLVELSKDIDGEKKLKLTQALNQLEKSEIEIDETLNNLKNKLSELGFGLIYETAQALTLFPI